MGQSDIAGIPQIGLRHFLEALLSCVGTASIEQFMSECTISPVLTSVLLVSVLPKWISRPTVYSTFTIHTAMKTVSRLTGLFVPQNYHHGNTCETAVPVDSWSPFLLDISKSLL